MNKKHYRELRRAARLAKLVKREGNGVTVDVYVMELPPPSGEDTPDVDAMDVDATPFDGYEAADYDTPKGERE